MRFLCDVMLGKLAKYLRLLGFDAAYARRPADIERAVASDPDRVFLTRRARPAGRASTVHIESELVREQVREIKALIKPAIEPGRVMGRCIECNVELVDIDRSDVEPRVPEFVFHNYARFKTCPSCGRIYWEGSHAAGMKKLLAEMDA